MHTYFIIFLRLLEQYIAAQHDLNKKENKPTVSQTIQNSIDLITTSTLEVELAAKEKEISQLVDDMQKLQMKSNKIIIISATDLREQQSEHSMRARAGVIHSGRGCNTIVVSLCHQSFNRCKVRHFVNR